MQIEDPSILAQPFGLKSWSAQQFAGFYQRHRDLLIRHAQIQSRDLNVAEELVQEAFLYLMVSLPELETELDALRFIKWKIKMLAIDLARKEAGLKSESLSILEDRAAEGEFDPLSTIERADDAAIVWAALNRLTERQRSALLEVSIHASSNEQAAAKFQLSGSAFRQLLVRSRASFRNFLVEEASAAGIDVQEILSLSFFRKGKRAIKVLASFALVPLLAMFVYFSPLGDFQSPPRPDILSLPDPSSLESTNTETFTRLSSPKKNVVTEAADGSAARSIEVVDELSAEQSGLVSAAEPRVQTQLLVATQERAPGVGGSSDEKRDVLEEEVRFVLSEFLIPNKAAELIPILGESGSTYTGPSRLGLVLTQAGADGSWDYTIQSLGVDMGLVLVPEITHTQLSETGVQGSFRLEFIGSGLRVADVSGLFENVAVGPNVISTMYFQGYVDFVNGAIVGNSITFFPSRSA